MSARVRYYFDVVCPFAYLGSTQIRRICEAAGATLEWRPMLLGGVYRAIGAPDFPSVPRNRILGNAIDTARWARRYGVPLEWSPGHPRRSVEAMRLLCAAEMSGDAARLEALTHALYRAYWADGEDVASRDLLARIGAAHGVPIEAVDRDDVKARLRAITDEAVAEGAFGAPTIVVDGGRSGHTMYFGQDRLGLVADELGLPRPAPRPRAAAPTGRQVEFLFDYSSPYTYLASTQIERVCDERGASLSWRPVLIGGLFKEIGNPLVPILEASEPKRRYLGRDLDDWSRLWGVHFRWPSRFPMNTIAALRMTLATDDKDVPRLAHALMRAYWVDDRDLNDKAELCAIADGVGLPGAALLERTGDPAIKAQLAHNTAAAVQAGAWGLPTFLVGDDLFFGQDRLDFVADALAGS
jgi:2-hydroxychromene-2-carboxylate isomerase